MSEKKPEAKSDPTSTPRRAAPGPLALGLTILALVALAAAGGFMFGRGGPFAERNRLPVLGQAPSYELTNQLGQKVNSNIFRGKIQIVTFLDPYCNDFCPLISVNLANFAANIRTSPLARKVAFVAFNVDPWQTGPKEMRGFLREFGWDPKSGGFQFLTGSVAETRHIVRLGFHVAFERVPNDDNGKHPVSGTPGHLQIALPNPLAAQAKPRYDIIHNDMIEIVDGKGRIRKIFSEADRVSDGELMETIHALLPTTSTGGNS